MGHAEVVDLKIPETKFHVFADQFWSSCPQGERADPQDAGGEYRSVVGLPGGVQSSLMKQLKEKASNVKFSPGKGNEGDTSGTGTVYVYDSHAFPAHIAERYHQFHDDMTAAYGSPYNSLRQFATKTKCPGDEPASFLAQPPTSPM